MPIKPVKKFRKLNCRKGRKDCQCISYKLYTNNDYICSGYVRRVQKGVAKADKIRLCDRKTFFIFQGTPDEAITIINCLSASIEQFMMNNRQYRKWRK